MNTKDEDVGRSEAKHGGVCAEGARGSLDSNERDYGAGLSTKDCGMDGPESAESASGLVGGSSEDHCSDDSRIVPESGASGMDPHELGRRGERAARLFLERRGYEILDINWTCFAGEVDIVSLDDDTLCFIEVKTRRGTSSGFPEEAVTSRKRDRYEKIAACYLKEHDFEDMRVRFDVISIMVIGEHRAFLRMHTNAFGVESLR